MAKQNDLISREALRNVILNDRKLDGVNANWEVNRILVHIDNAPTVEINTNDIEYKAYCKGLEDGKKIARPQGEWIAIEPYNHKTFCPFCKKDTRDMNYDNFCSNCGAKLKGGAE